MSMLWRYSLQMDRIALLRKQIGEAAYDLAAIGDGVSCPPMSGMPRGGEPAGIVGIVARREKVQAQIDLLEDNLRESQSEVDRILQTMEHLRPIERQVLLLRHGQTHPEDYRAIARQYHYSYGYIRNVYYKAVKKMETVDLPKRCDKL